MSVRLGLLDKAIEIGDVDPLASGLDETDGTQRAQAFDRAFAGQPGPLPELFLANGQLQIDRTVGADVAASEGLFDLDQAHEAGGDASRRVHDRGLNELCRQCSEPLCNDAQQCALELTIGVEHGSELGRGHVVHGRVGDRRCGCRARTVVDHAEFTHDTTRTREVKQNHAT